MTDITCTLETKTKNFRANFRSYRFLNNKFILNHIFDFVCFSTFIFQMSHLKLLVNEKWIEPDEYVHNTQVQGVINRSIQDVTLSFYFKS